MTQREYRGRRLDNGQWVEGWLVVGTENKAYYIFTRDEIAQWLVDPDTVGQFTGLQDKQGQRIFEGDIVHVKAWRMNGVVNYSSGMFKVQDVDRDTNPSLASFQSELRCEVIGNRWDHPHLLNKAQ